MASKVLYPPSIDSSMPAFVNTNGCRIYFSLSKFNASSDFKNIHVAIRKQVGGISVVNTNYSMGATGIVINVPAKAEEDGTYSAVIPKEYLRNGWEIGTIYKIQIRLSAVEYSSGVGQAVWLNENAGYFSEWSTVCIVKPIAVPKLKVTNFNFYDDINVDTTSLECFIDTSTLDISGQYSNQDTSEVLKTYQMSLYEVVNNHNVLLEESDVLYSANYELNQFKYLFQTELEEQKNYILTISIETLNGYKNSIDFYFETTIFYSDEIDAHIITVDNDVTETMDSLTSVAAEGEEGRIGYKIYSPSDEVYTGNICIRRADSRDNFKTWTDIKVITVKTKALNELPIYYDYTIESGVWYKYGIQAVNGEGERGVLNKMATPIMREFDYTFLLGKDNTQLKIKFDNTLSGYTIVRGDGQADTIGGKYPVVQRNAALGYKSFSLGGLISFNMDEQELFVSKQDVYKYPSIVQYYENYNRQHYISQYDYIYEREFRQKVIEFLDNGEPKLLKSPTEGNIIVRLLNFSFEGKQELSRMIYSFSCSAVEIDDYNMESCLSYKFYELADYELDFDSSEVKIGQITGEYPAGTDIISLIKDKYNVQLSEDYSQRVISMQGLKITINSNPGIAVFNSDKTAIGNIIIYNNKEIYINDISREYDFGEVVISEYDTLKVKENVDITVDFLFTAKKEKTVHKQKETKELVRGVGQLADIISPSESLYSKIYAKYYIDWTEKYRELLSVSEITITAAPNAVFLIKDEGSVDTGSEEDFYQECNETGVLTFGGDVDLKEIKYIGIREDGGKIDTTVPSDSLIDYHYLLMQGLYKGGL